MIDVKNLTLVEIEDHLTRVEDGDFRKALEAARDELVNEMSIKSEESVGTPEVVMEGE